MIRLPPRSTPLYSSAASDVYKRQVLELPLLAQRLDAHLFHRPRDLGRLLAPHEFQRVGVAPGHAKAASDAASEVDDRQLLDDFDGVHGTPLLAHRTPRA